MALEHYSLSHRRKEQAWKTRGGFLLPLFLGLGGLNLRSAARSRRSVRRRSPIHNIGRVSRHPAREAEDPSAPRDFVGFRLLATPKSSSAPTGMAMARYRCAPRPTFIRTRTTPTHRRFRRFAVLRGILAQTWNRTSIWSRSESWRRRSGPSLCRYDDMVNPLLDQPLAYNYLLYHPGQSSGDYGLTPVTIYGLPAAEPITPGTIWTRDSSSPPAIRIIPATFFSPASIHNGLRVADIPFVRDSGSACLAYSGTVAGGISGVSDCPPDVSASNLSLERFGVRRPVGARTMEHRRRVGPLRTSIFPASPIPPTLSFGYVEAKMIITSTLVRRGPPQLPDGQPRHLWRRDKSHYGLPQSRNTTRPPSGSARIASSS